MEEWAIYKPPPERSKMGLSSTKAKNKYNAANYDRINLTMPKGRKEEIKAHADKQGESLNGFINRAIDETIEKDNKKQG